MRVRRRKCAGTKPSAKKCLKELKETEIGEVNCGETLGFRFFFFFLIIVRVRFRFFNKTRPI